jgi:tetratricopeptide (TPR) repeat protein
MDMFTEAIKNFNVAREISFGNYYSNLTKAYEDINSRKYTSALARATSAIEENPTDPIPHSYKGISLYHLGKFDDAIVHLNTANKLDPDNSATIYNLGLAYIASDDTEEAISQFEKAMSIDPSLKRDIELAGTFESE